MANVVTDKLTQANQIKEQIRTVANAKNAGIPEGAPFADYPGYLEGLPEQLENVPITLDFSGGDQTITAAEGTVVKSAIIQKPANLIPENIAEGVDIAGIVGALAGGGGAKFAYGSFSGTGQAETIEHGLGIVPDVVVVWRETNPPSTSYSTQFAIGVSQKFKESIGGSSGGFFLRMAKYSSSASNSSYYSGMGSVPEIDATSTNAQGVHDANKTSFVIGSTGFYPPASGSTYFWLAIGGLT